MKSVASIELVRRTWQQPFRAPVSLVHADIINIYYNFIMVPSV